MNERGKRNLKLMLVFIFVGALISGLGTYGIMNKKVKDLKIENQKLESRSAVKKEGIIFENEKVAIKYYDVENQKNSYDILVETKNGTNITSEYDLKAGQNDNFVYLIGRDFETAFNFWYDNLKPKKLEWSWDPNYTIERD